jgi:hypothetical protein
MKSTVFSVLKIVVIAMMLVWAVGSTVPANAQQSCNYQCEYQCMSQIGICTEYCGGNPRCIGMCESQFYSCMAGCGCPT